MHRCSPVQVPVDEIDLALAGDLFAPGSFDDSTRLYRPDSLMMVMSCSPEGVVIRHPLGYGQIPAKRGSNKTLHPSGETERGASRPAALGYNDTADALKRHVDNEDKQILKTGETPVLNVPNRGLAPAIKIMFYMLFMVFLVPWERAQKGPKHD